MACFHAFVSRQGVSSAWVLMNGRTQQAGMKMRGERPCVGKAMPPCLTANLNKNSDVYNFLKTLIDTYKDIPFSFMMRTVK